MTWRVHDSRPRRDERGSVAIEAAIGVPAFGLFIAMIILAGRVQIAKQSVGADAYEGRSAGGRGATEGVRKGRSRWSPIDKQKKRIREWYSIEENDTPNNI